MACLHTVRNNFHMTIAWRNYPSFQFCFFQHIENTKALGLSLTVILEDQSLTTGTQALNKTKIFKQILGVRRGEMGDILILYAPKLETNPFCPVHDLKWTSWQILRSLYVPLSPPYNMGHDWFKSELKKDTSFAITFFFLSWRGEKGIKCVTVLRQDKIC